MCGHVWLVGKLKALDQQELKNPTFSVPRSFHDMWGTAHLRRAPDASRAPWGGGGEGRGLRTVRLSPWWSLGCRWQF